MHKLELFIKFVIIYIIFLNKIYYKLLHSKIYVNNKQIIINHQNFKVKNYQFKLNNKNS